VPHALFYTGMPEFSPIRRKFADLISIINLFAVKWYGESEFWLSSGKLLLIIMLFCFTFITMVGGNPHHDAYGFRYWHEPVSIPSKTMMLQTIIALEREN
jgi:amino acid permease